MERTEDGNAAKGHGRTLVFGGGTDLHTGDEGRFVLVFVTPRLIDP